MSDSLRPPGLYSPWNSPGQNTGVGSLSLLQELFPNQGLNPGLPHCRWILYQLTHEGSPKLTMPSILKSFFTSTRGNKHRCGCELQPCTEKCLIPAKGEGAAEKEMVREHHQLNGHESEKTPGDSGGQRSLVCCSPWGHKESGMTW